MTLPIFIGYDHREDEAAQVCRLSLARRTSEPLHIVMLDQSALRWGGLYDRPFTFHGPNRIDDRDGKPFSTDFSFTRFLVPALSLFKGWALFCDCDFLFTQDIAKLFALADAKYAAMVVKHQHEPVEIEKMDGILQTRYHRKNWSSLVLWNCGHPANRCLDLETVNLRTGQWLHAFQWLEDDQIGALPMGWNWLSGVNEPLDHTPEAVHFTLGGAWFENCQHFPYSDLWRAERDRMEPAKLKVVK